MLMARKNLDQALSNSKNQLIKFNEKIASKYRDGLSISYLDSYIEKDVVPNSIKQFIVLNATQQTNRKDFESILTNNSPKKIDWFFDKIIDSRDIIDFKFDKVTKTKDSISFSLKNKTETNVPISVYGIKDKNIVYKKNKFYIYSSNMHELLIPGLTLTGLTLNFEKSYYYNSQIKYASLRDYNLIRDFYSWSLLYQQYKNDFPQYKNENEFVKSRLCDQQELIKSWVQYSYNSLQ
jgi:hypothetical protein